MSDEQRQYLSYLLRLWQEPVTLAKVWRASLEDPQTGELFGFGDVAQLFAYLEQQIGAPSARQASHPTAHSQETAIHAARASPDELHEEIIVRLKSGDKQ